MAYLTFAHLLLLMCIILKNNFHIAMSCLFRLIRCAIVIIGTEILQVEKAAFFYFLLLIFKPNESGVYLPLSKTSEALSCGRRQGACIVLRLGGD